MQELAAPISFTQERPSAPRRRGRPREPVPAHLAEAMLEWVADGKPLRRWCDQPGSVSVGAVRGWLATDPALAARYAWARQQGFDAICGKILTLADTPHRNALALAWTRLRIRVLFVLLERWFPRAERKPPPGHGPDRGRIVRVSVSVS
jgi:hypothetical protein